MRSRLDFKEDSKILQNLSTDAFATFYVLRTFTKTSSELMEQVLTWIEKHQSHDAYSLALAALTNLIQCSSDSFLSRTLPLCVSALQDKSFHSRRVGTSLLHNLLVNLTMRKARSNGPALKTNLPEATTALRDILRERSGKDEEVDRNFLLCLSRVTYVVFDHQHSNAHTRLCRKLEHQPTGTSPSRSFEFKRTRMRRWSECSDDSRDCVVDGPGTWLEY